MSTHVSESDIVVICVIVSDVERWLVDGGGDVGGGGGGGGDVGGGGDETLGETHF